MISRLVLLSAIYCLYIIPSYSQNLIDENFSSSIPAGWSIISEEDPNPWSWSDIDYSFDDTGLAIISSEDGGENNHSLEILESPEFDGSSSLEISLFFEFMYLAGEGDDSVYVDVYNGTEWTNIWKLGDGEGEYEARLFFISEFLDGNSNCKVRFRYDDNNSLANYWLIDNVLIKTNDCIAPSGLTVGNITGTSAVLSWDGNGEYTDIAYGPVGTAPYDMDLFIWYEESPQTMLWLDRGTSYDVYMRSECDFNNYSNWVGPITFETLDPCPNSITLDTLLPYTLIQESLCDHEDLITSTPCSFGNPGNEMVFSIDQYSGNLRVILSNSDSDEDLYVSFTKGCPGEADAVCLSEGVLSPEDESISITADLNNYETYFVTVTGDTSLPCTFDLKIADNNCNIPTDLSSLSYPDSTVLNWNSNSQGSADSWILEWSIGDFTPGIGEGTIIEGYYNSYSSSTTLTNLDPNVIYTYYVKDVCGVNWIGAFSWEVGEFTGPGLENDLCGGATEILCSELYTADTRVATAGDNPEVYCGPTAVAQAVWYSFIGNGDVMSINVNGTNFYPGINIYSGSCDDLFCVAGSNSDYEFSKAVTFETELDEEYLVLVSGVFDNPQSRGIFDISLNCSACLDILYNYVALSATDTLAGVSWTSQNIGETYVIEFGELGFTFGEGEQISGISDSLNNVTVSGLLPLTEYELYVYEICSNDGISFPEKVIFTTSEFEAAINDLCTNAVIIGCEEEYLVDGTALSTISNPLNNVCSDLFLVSEMAWYKVIGEGKQVTIKSCLSTNPAALYLFEGTCDSLVCISTGQSNDEDCPFSQWQDHSKLEFFGHLETEYLIAIGASSGASWGTYHISMDCVGCGEPALINIETEDTISQINWSSFTDETIYTMAYFEESEGLENATIVENLTDDDLPFLIQNLESGVNYQACIYGLCAEDLVNSDTICTSWLTNNAPTPLNDNICNAFILENGIEYSTTNLYATIENGEPSPETGLYNDPEQLTWGEGSIASTTWYSFTPIQNGLATISTCHDESYDTQLAVYVGDTCLGFNGFNLVAANDDNYNCSANTVSDANRTSTVVLCVEENLKYYIQVDPFDFFNVPAGADFGISVMMDYNEIEALITIPNSNSCIFNWNYNSDSGDQDFKIILTNTSTLIVDSIFGNTADLPIVLEGLAEDQLYEYSILIDDLCQTTVGPQIFTTLASSIEDQYLNNDFVVFPNPAVGQVIIEIKGVLKDECEIILTNMQGKSFFERKLNKGSLNERVSINTIDLAAGMYFIVLKSKNTSSQKKFILK